MPAGLPLGNDDSQWDVGLGSFGLVGAAASALSQLTQANVEAFYKDYVQNNSSWGAASNSMFAGLFPDGETPFPVLFLSAIMEQLLGVVPGGTTVINLLTELGNFFGDKWGDLADAISDIGDFLVGLVGAHDVDEVVEYIQNLLGPNSPLNLANAFGWITQIDLGSIGRFSPNLLSEGDFAEAVTINPSSGYTWDSGAAVVVANGTDKPLISEVVPVTENQVISAGVMAMYQSATGTAGGQRVELVSCVLDPMEASGYAVVSTTVLGSLTPSGTSSYATLADDYTVPDGVDGVALKLSVTSNMTAGTARFKQAFIKKTQALPIPFVDQLPDTLTAAAARVQSIIDRIINAFENLGSLVDTDLGVDGVLDAIFGIFDVGLGARANAAAIEARVRQLESAANAIVIDFAGTSSTSLSGWTVSSSGGGAGSMGPDGKGNLSWHSSGAGNRTQLGRYDGGSLSVDNGRAEWILSSSPQSYVFDDAWTYVQVRMQDNSNCLRIRSGYGEIRIQAVVSGTVTNIGSAWSGNPKAGDQFAFDFGEAAGANTRHFVLYRNGAPIINVTDSGAVSLVGSSYRKIGAGMETGNRLVFFQNIPAGLGVLTATEVL